jgi:hypothetical protein
MQIIVQSASTYKPFEETNGGAVTANGGDLVRYEEVGFWSVDGDEKFYMSEI